MVFKPSGIYHILSGFLISGGNNIRNSAEESLEKINQQTSIEKMEEKEIQQWVTQLQHVVLHNRACLFLAKGLKSYQDTGWKIVSDVFAILILVLYTVFSFAVINSAFFKINPSFFAFPTPPSFFQFFYYSFNVLLFNQIQEVVAITPISQIASMVEAFFALFLIAIFVSLVLTFRSQKDADALRDVIKELTKEGHRMEVFIRDRYHIDGIDIALETLRKFKAVFIDFLYTLTEATK